MSKYEVRTTREIRRTGGLVVPAGEIIAEVETFVDEFEPHAIAQYLRSGQLEVVPLHQEVEVESEPESGQIENPE